MRATRRLGWSVLLLVLLGAAAPLAAQEWAGRGRLQGGLKDEEGKPVAGARLTFRKGTGKVDPAAPGPQPVTSNDKGKWSVGGLAGGDWGILIEKDGFLISEGQVKVSEFGPTNALNITLKKPSKEMLEAEAKSGDNAIIKAALEQGNAYMQASLWSMARAEYDKALPKLEGETLAEARAQVLRAIGQTWAMEQKWDLAVEKIELANTVNPNNADTLNLLAQTYYQSGNADKAIETLKLAIAARPGDATITKLLVDLLVDAGREEEAKPYIAQLPEGTKVDPVSLLNVGIRNYNDGKYDKAIETYNRVLADNPEMPEPYFYRSYAYMPLGKMKEAKADLLKFLSLAPNHAKAKEAKEMLDAM